MLGLFLWKLFGEYGDKMFFLKAYYLTIKHFPERIL
jgi:hypothetical protein